MADAAPDDWVPVGQQATAPQQASSAAPPDDWVAVSQQKPSVADQLNPLKAPAAQSIVREVEAGAKSAKDAFGSLSEGRLSPENEKYFQDKGLIRKPGENYSSPLQAFNETAIRTGAATVEDIKKGLSAVLAAPAGVAAQAVKEMGGGDAQAERMRRDVGGMEEMATMSHIPEADLLHGAQAPLSTSEDIQGFLKNADTAAPKPKPFSQTRAEIDEFLANKAAQEAAAGTGQPRLTGPDDWTQPAAEQAAPQPSAPEPGTPSFEEPGRTAPVTGTPPGYIERTFQVESSGGRAPDRPGSQYQGLAQFGAAERARYGITDPHSVEQNTAALTREAEANTRPLTKALGRPPDAGELYLAHQQGLGGAVAQLSQPDRPAWQNLANTAEGRAKGEGWAKQAIWGNLPASVKARYGSVDNVTGADFVDAVKGFYTGAHAQAPAGGEAAPAAPQGGPHVLQALMDDERPADQIRKEGFTPPPGQAPPEPKPPAEQAPDLEAIMADKRSAEQIRADLQAHHTFTPSGEWQPVPRPTHGAPPLPENLEYALDATGQPIARIPQLPPPAPPPPAPPPVGIRQNPVAVIAPNDVHKGTLAALPTPGQFEAENFPMRHAEWHGVPITIKVEKDAQRIGTGPDGSQWSVAAVHPEGYIKRVVGADKENLDFIVGPNPNSGHVYVVDQIAPQTGKFDEHKVFGGFNSAAEARRAYEARFSDQSGAARIGDMQRMSVPQFKQWLKEGDLNKPVAYTDPSEAARAHAKEIGLNPFPEAVQAAGDAVRVNNADLTHAVYTGTENSALARTATLMDNAREKGLADAWTTLPAAADQGGEGPHAPSERPAGTIGEGPAGGAPARGEPAQAERAPSEAGEVAPAASAVEPAPEPEEVDAPKILGHAPTLADLTKFKGKIASLGAEERATAREHIDALTSHMEEHGKKIAEHCLQSGGKFSLRS